MEKIKSVKIGSPEYPPRLSLIHDPPSELFVIGELPKSVRAVGIVGARMCSEYGRGTARLLGSRLSSLGVPVISGMALGIDSASQAGALSAGGKTFAVLGCGADICYPKSSKRIYENIISSGGGIISEFPAGTPPLRENFPQRNRIISGLCDVLVVVEAKKGSGSLITADFALEQGKDVWAFPGRYGENLSYGCNRLISQGAGIIYDIDVFLESIGVLCRKAGGGRKKGKRKSAAQNRDADIFPSGSDERKILEKTEVSPKHIEKLIDELSLPLPRLLVGLENLKNTGIIYEPYNNYYCRRID